MNEETDEYPIGSVGYWIGKKETIPEINRLDLASRSGLETLSVFDKSDKGHKIMCKDYLIRANTALFKSGKSLTLQGIEEERDLHCFLRINSGSHKNQFLHLQVYSGMIKISSKERNVLVSAYIKREPVDDTPNIGSSWQKQLSLDDSAEFITSVEDILR